MTISAKDTFIEVEVDDAVASDADLAAKLTEVCPVDIFTVHDDGLSVVEENVDECVLCRLCIDAAPQGTVKIHKLYTDGESLSS
ncbi:MAG: 4Fe-4S dicluster domain-containing protein [Solirubrobacterales bacterium]